MTRERGSLRRRVLAIGKVRPQWLGPALAAVMGRSAGTVEGFKYSDAMASSGIVWDEITLDAYLADTNGNIPKNRMVFPGLVKRGRPRGCHRIFEAERPMTSERPPAVTVSNLM